MPNPNFRPSQIKNKIKREEESRKRKRAKSKLKLEKRLERAKLESKDPAAKKKRLEENVPKTLDNMREYDPSTVLTADPSTSSAKIEETNQDFSNDPFASYFNESSSSSTSSSTPSDGAQKVLITTSPKASKPTYEFCDELVGIFPGAEFIRRKKGKGFELGKIAGWAGKRGYNHLCVVNEDHKKPNAITLVYLPNGPTAYFKLTSIALTKQIYGHARATAHYPELVLNNFVTRLGHLVGRMFQTLFPPVPEFQGRQVVTLHNQRDFLFFRRHRYAFRSPEKVALQEIGPRFTLKLRWLKKGIPAVKDFGAAPPGLQFDTAKDEGDDDEEEEEPKDNEVDEEDVAPKSSPQEIVLPKEDEFIWAWKPELEPTRRTFHL